MAAPIRAIGLLGGSFNPAHEGHLNISLYALKKLKLAEVWWLVSPHNPLKSKESLAAYEERLASARKVAASHPHIRVMDIEREQGLYYSYQTIAFLKRRWPRVSFVWLMGADNLAQFHRWRRWRKILLSIPIIVFDRVPYSYTATVSKAAQYSHKFYRKNSDIGRHCRPPALWFIRLKRDPSSSTALRKHLEKPHF